MASRFVGLSTTAFRSAIARPCSRLTPAVGVSARHQTSRNLHASSVRLSNQGGDKKKSYMQPELIPLYAIVAFAVSAGLYSIGRHLFSDNDIRRLPEHPVDEQGNPTHKAQHRPDWQPETWKEPKERK